MQIKSCLKTQGLLNVIHYTVYLFISNIGTGSPGGRQRQAERPKSRRVNYQQNELFHPQPPPAPSRPLRPGCPRPASPPAASPRSSGCAILPMGLQVSFFFVFLYLSFDQGLCLSPSVSSSPLSHSVSVSDSVSASVFLAVSFSTPGLFCHSLWPFSVSLISSCNRDRDLE